ncbi:MAG: NfeD family protein [Cyanobacteria bacterium P01_A01_bin.45]
MTSIWLAFGAILCLFELFLPTAFVAMIMGISAILVALLSLVVEATWIQGLTWVILSTLLVVFTRRYIVPTQNKPKIRDAIVGKTLTEIPEGRTGRVLYEGNSWQARCDDEQMAIAADEKVYVLRREGTTLVIMPDKILRSGIDE